MRSVLQQRVFLNPSPCSDFQQHTRDNTKSWITMIQQYQSHNLMVCYALPTSSAVSLCCVLFLFLLCYSCTLAVYSFEFLVYIYHRNTMFTVSCGCGFLDIAFWSICDVERVKTMSTWHFLSTCCVTDLMEDRHVLLVLYSANMDLEEVDV